jgi:hypothetical protein
VLATILELKQSFNENIQSIDDKLETLSKKFEDENKMLKQEIMSKESEITQLKAALQEEKHANGRLRVSSLSSIDWIFSLKLCFSSRIVASTKELLGLMPLLVSLLTTSCMLPSSLSFCVLVFRLLLDRSGLRSAIVYVPSR